MTAASLGSTGSEMPPVTTKRMAGQRRQSSSAASSRSSRVVEGLPCLTAQPSTMAVSPSFGLASVRVAAAMRENQAAMKPAMPKPTTAPASERRVPHAR